MSMRILIVEDEPKNMKLARDVLRSRGYETLEATNGRDGVEMARREKPDLILMDMQMPVMDGLQATRLLKLDPVTRDIPIIALTASAMDGDEHIAIGAGCDGYITKPIAVRGFLEKLERFLEAKEGLTTDG